MKNIKTMTREEALQKIQDQKESEGFVGVFYKILENADDTLKSYYEEKLIESIIMGDAMGRTLASTDPGTQEYSAIMNGLTAAAQKTRMSVEEELENIEKAQMSKSDE